MQKILVLIAFWSLSAIAAPPFLDPLPIWAQDSLYAGVYLDVAHVMQKESMSFFEVAELQNQMRDLMDHEKVSESQAYERALAQVRAGHFESGWTPVTFTENADFVAVLDLDETLMVQWYASGTDGNYDLADVPADRSRGPQGQEIFSGTFVKFTPKAEEFIRGLKANPHCKAVALYSAKIDEAVWGIVKKWKFADGSPVTDYVKGVFTRNYLFLGTGNMIPSKDMRIFDPELKHVVIIDDNPARVVQPLVNLAQPKFDGDQYLKAAREKNTPIMKHYDEILMNSLANLNETMAASERLAIPFGEAFKAHSYFGERITKSLTQSLGSRAEALDVTRLHPFLHSASFVPAPQKAR